MAKKKSVDSNDLFAEPVAPELEPVADVPAEPSIPLPQVPASWLPLFKREFAKPYMAELREFVAGERRQFKVYPPGPEVFQAFQLTPLVSLKVLILGQDPYHGENQAHGLSFSVKPGIRTPPSLVNIYKELHADMGLPIPQTGYLKPWAERGVMMLNAVLTVRAATPNSHKDQGWETFTDAAIAEISANADPVAFVLWGAYAQKKGKLIDAKKHLVIKTAHPSPFSADNGFFGSKPFSRINGWLVGQGKEPIDWAI